MTKERADLQAAVDSWERIKHEFDELALLFELAVEEEDEDTASEVEVGLEEVEKGVHHLEFQRMLGGKNDRNNAFVTLHPGAGGTEAQDWAQMLMRMYLRWAERNDCKIDIVDYQPGDEAGVKSVTIHVKGDYAFGYLKAEIGIHRLVRISPFDTNRRRHTSFVSVLVIPEIDEDINIEIEEKELRIDTYRSSGAGGQHVNKTDSAVRITHIPTGIVVQCQNERSQHKNKAMALKMLKARFYEKEEEKRREEMQELHDKQSDIAWGSQIRSYVLHPYRMIKDHRTNVEIGNVDVVLDGDLGKFIEAYLMS